MLHTFLLNAERSEIPNGEAFASRILRTAWRFWGANEVGLWASSGPMDTMFRRKFPKITNNLRPDEKKSQMGVDFLPGKLFVKNAKQTICDDERIELDESGRQLYNMLRENFDVVVLFLRT